MQWQIGREPEHFDERLRELEGDARAAEVLVLRLAVGAARVNHRVRGGQLVARQVVIGDDDINTGGTGGRDGSVRCYSTIAGDDQLRTDALGLGETGGPQIVTLADSVRDEGVHRRARAAQ